MHGETGRQVYVAGLRTIEETASQGGYFENYPVFDWQPEKCFEKWSSFCEQELRRRRRRRRKVWKNFGEGRQNKKWMEENFKKRMAMKGAKENKKEKNRGGGGGHKWGGGGHRWRKPATENASWHRPTGIVSTISQTNSSLTIFLFRCYTIEDERVQRKQKLLEN